MPSDYKRWVVFNHEHVTKRLLQLKLQSHWLWTKDFQLRTVDFALKDLDLFDGILLEFRKADS